MKNVNFKKILAVVVMGGLFGTFGPAPLTAANLASATAQVKDSLGAVRTSFSSTERITLSIRVQNTAASSNSIVFSFVVKDPAGSRRLSQTGNSAPGSVVGFTGASLQGIPVSNFYTTPGSYTLEATATLGSESTTATTVFTVLSPVMTLTYPPDGARDLIDQPLTFRWVSSGASRYRFFLDDDISFYNALFSDETVVNFFSYPQNPPDIRQRLASGQDYYWKVEGLDASGNVVARTEVPFRFTVKVDGAQATSKDVAVVDLKRVDQSIPGAPGAMPISVSVKNQGGRSEMDVTLNLFADGAAAPRSPKKIRLLEPGQTKEFVFPVGVPTADRSVLVNAVVDFFDDNLQNNSMTKQIEASNQRRRRLNPQEMWEILRKKVTDLEILSELEGYSVVGIERDGLSSRELNKLILAVEEGRARVVQVDLDD